MWHVPLRQDPALLGRYIWNVTVNSGSLACFKESITVPIKLPRLSVCGPHKITLYVANKIYDYRKIGDQVQLELRVDYFLT